jgi:hypothetical protein
MTGTDPFYADLYTADGALKFFLNGRWQESTSGKTVSIANPCIEGDVAFRVQGACAAPRMNAAGSWARQCGAEWGLIAA